jgi:phage-related protein
VRTNIKDGTARVFFCVSQNSMVLLHGFIKKSQQTPQKELELADKRKKEVESWTLKKAH